MLNLLFECSGRQFILKPMFDHEKMHVYQLSRELNREICRLTKIASKGSYDHLDQVVRGGSSISRNVSEGSGEWSPKEKAKFYRYARRSASEVAAGLDVLVDYEMLRQSDIEYAKELVHRIISMLVKLIQLFERGGGNRPKNEGRRNAALPMTVHWPDDRTRARSP